MKLIGLLAAAAVVAALTCLDAPQTLALEIVNGANPAHLDDGMIAKAYVAGRGGHWHGGVYRGPRGGTYYHGGGPWHGGVYGGPHRYGYHPGYPGYRAGSWGGWARPGGYWWPVGGAIAAGAAIGMVSAATAAAWAGPPPGPGVCWYYTDPSGQQGFWDACQ